MSKLTDSVVVVTGASSGVGRAAALAFAQAGANVVVSARRADALDDVAAACRELGPDAIAVPADVRDADAVDAVARRALDRFGRIDVWVNNAAVTLFAPVDEAPVELWHQVVETNLFGAFHGTRAALRPMREQASGVIINVGSVLSRMPVPQQSAYVASKHALRALADCTRQEVRDVPGISICTILPGPLDTPLYQHAANHTGRRIHPMTPVIDANRAAEAIVSCAQRPRRSAVVGATGWPLLGLESLLPGLLERLLARQIDIDHFGARTAPRWDGNVAAPLDREADVSGGWSRSGQQVGAQHPGAASNPDLAAPLRALVLAGAVGAGAVGAAVGALRGRRS
jgi:NAD(P)-dependent dehydrogenase (short-subunit alcohol dehydrogenase family)